MNNYWIFWIPGQTEKQEVRLPHNMVELPLNHVLEESFQVLGRYEKIIPYEERFQGKRVFVRFQAVAHVATVYLNEMELQTHYGGYTAFEVELTDYLVPGDNVLRVDVSSKESENLPPFGGVVDYLGFGGIYREVDLLIRDNSYLEDFYLYPVDVLTEPKLVFQGKINRYQSDHHLVIEQQVGEKWHRLFDEVVGEEIHVTFSPAEAKLWSPECPVLYEFKISLDGSEELVRIGFREAVFKTDGFYLNGQKRDLIGLNRHQSYPYVGYAVPKALQRYDAKILKEELALDVVRTSHYPQSHHFIDACDELGLLVITETPGWQHLGDDVWQERSLAMTEALVKQYRHHPSIILWGTRINESTDLEVFYSEANRLAKVNDPVRQTTGVRAHRNSQFLEDVYGYNDFSHNGLTPGLLPKADVCGDVPYFVAEHNGHMFPVKSFDHESLRLSQLKRHTSVLDAYYQSPGISGVIGWCMADYYTHQDFGSGDTICYHGVMDAFRIAKPAASIYSVRRDEPVLEVMGNLSIGEYPAILMPEIIVMSNLPEVEVFKNERLIARLRPDRERFPGLPFPPLIMQDLIGNQLEAKGYFGPEAELVKEAVYQAVNQGKPETKLEKQVLPILQKHGHQLSDLGSFYTRYVGNWGDKAAEYVFRAGDLTIRSDRARQPRLKIRVSHHDLIDSETYDMALVRIEALDASGSRLPYLQAALRLEATGSIELIGPSEVALAGGAVGILVKSISPGPGELKIRSQRLGDESIHFQVYSKK